MGWLTDRDLKCPKCGHVRTAYKQNYKMSAIICGNLSQPTFMSLISTARRFYREPSITNTKIAEKIQQAFILAEEERISEHSVQFHTDPIKI